ncbi:MAG: DUF4295 family protein [Bacteroidia bacterium]|nr:DUF4295 family protein [Bacteroidia bacterium]MCC7533786.1 DUF4295 family protein [Bacteroidia bacterium]MCZ2140141.1 DUF4295 domain-containing protein [Bacteroidia bacterium]
MAKKVVATLKTGAGKDFAKIYRAVKNKKGSYSFKSEIVPNDNIKAQFKG